MVSNQDPSSQSQQKDCKKIEAAGGAISQGQTREDALKPAITTFKTTFQLQLSKEETDALARQSITFLQTKGVWDRVMRDAHTFRQKTEQLAPQLKTGFHASNSLWKNLPPLKLED